MSDALCTKYGCDYKLDQAGQVTFDNCGALPKSSKKYAGLSKNQAEAVVAIFESFPAKHFRKAVKIAWCESRLNPGAINKVNSNLLHTVVYFN